MFPFIDVDEFDPRRKKGIFLCRLNSADAEAWIVKYNIGNRRLRKHLVDFLIYQIKTGEWQEDHPQPIVFSDLGRMIDGQHRLYAIAKAGLVNGDYVQVRVECGVPDQVREYLDTGISRTLDDRVELHPDKSVNAFIAKVVNSWTDISRSKTNGKRPSPEDAKEFYAQHKDAILKIQPIHKREKGVGIMIVAVAAMEYYERVGDPALDFFTDMFRPAGVIQQAQMLRDFLMRCPSHGYGSRLEIYQKAIACMKAHEENREVKKVIRCSTW